MRKFLCLVVFTLSFIVSFSQNRFYAKDIVQSKIDSAHYMSAVSYIESLEKIDDTKLNEECLEDNFSFLCI